MKVVVDTNVIFSGIFFQGAPGSIVEGILNKIYQIVLSEEIVREYRDVIIRYACKKKALDLIAPLEIIDLLISGAFFVDTDGIVTPTCADPDKDP